MIKLMLLTLLTQSPLCFAQGTAVERHMVEVGRARERALKLTEMINHNAPLVRLNQPILCNIRTAATGQEIQAAKMKFKDGTEGTFIMIQADGPVFSNRHLHVARLENGVLKSSRHHIVWSAAYGGWRFEREPGKAKTDPKYDRFGDVESWSIENVDLHAMAGCSRTSPPLISSTPPATVLTSDEVEAAR